MPIGSLNPCPFRVGGGRTPSEKAYASMRRAVGVGGSAANDLGIDGLWRRSRAKGVAAGASASERAGLQNWPHLATDALPYHGRVLGLLQEAGETEADFRHRVWEEWVTRLQVDVPNLLIELQKVDHRFSIIEPTCTTTTIAGRLFACLTPYGYAGYETPAWGLYQRDVTAYPQYSTDLKVHVLFAQGYSGVPRLGDQRLIERAKELLARLLPSWVDFGIITQIVFRVATSPLGRHGVTGS